MSKRLCCLFSAALVSLIAIGCSDDPVGSSSSPLSGVWIFDSTSTNSVVSVDPADTLTFRSDMTGSYRSEIGWGPYDFTYTVRNDSLFRTRTAGQSAGTKDTCDYVRNGDQLELGFTFGTTVRIAYLTRHR